jgi:hypothetical protein
MIRNIWIIIIICQATFFFKRIMTESDITRSTLNSDSFKCNLCSNNFTIVLATGRSGSTSMVGMLNQLPRYDIGGEQHGQLIGLQQMYNDFSTTRLYSSVTKKGGAWYSRKMSKMQFLCWAQSFFLVQSGSKERFDIGDVHGFKEIRYNTTEQLDFLNHIFPCAKYIINYRIDLEAQTHSAFRADNSVSELDQFNKVLLKFAHKHRHRSFIFPLEFYSNESHWNQLFRFLDRPQCKVISVVHSNANGSLAVDNSKTIIC